MNSFDKACEPICRRIVPYLKGLPDSVKDQTQEIRLRVNRPVILSAGGKLWFLKENGEVSHQPQERMVTLYKPELDETFRNLCSCSVYTHQNEIRNGYITIRGGHRVGLCGTAVVQDGSIQGIRDISSLNIRVARQIDGAADELLRLAGDTLMGGLLLAGPPSSGKTTLLRDLARQLASQSRWGPRKIAVVDERGELAGTFLGQPQNDLGCCDILDSYPKGEGILQAVRCLSPELIVCDELGGDQEVLAVEAGLNAGVAIAASIHAGELADLLRRRQARRLLQTEAFQTVVLLDGQKGPGNIKGIYKAGELNDQINRSYGNLFGVSDGGLHGIP